MDFVDREFWTSAQCEAISVKVWIHAGVRVRLLLEERDVKTLFVLQNHLMLVQW